MKVEHKGSHRANRFDLLKSPPLFSELIKMINKVPDLTKEEKAYFALSLCCGARVSEVCNVRYRDITFHGYNGELLEPKDVLLSNIATVRVIFNNLKNKKTKYKKHSIIKNMIFLEPVEWLKDRYNEIGPSQPDAKIYTKSRLSAYWLNKKLGDDWFPHKWRHMYISNLAAAGVSPQLIRVGAGWSSLEPWSTYAHLTSKELETELKRYYGDSVPVGDPNKPLSLRQATAAVIAKTGLEDREAKSPKNQTRIERLAYINNEVRAIPLNRHIRYAADQLKKEGIKPRFTKKIEESSILEVV